MRFTCIPFLHPTRSISLPLRVMLSEAKHLALDKWVSLTYLQTSSHGAFTFRAPCLVSCVCHCEERSDETISK